MKLFGKSRVLAKNKFWYFMKKCCKAKESGDVSMNGAVGQMYQEIAGRHRGKAESVQIIKTAIVPAKDCRREHVTQWHDYTVKYPVIKKMPLVGQKKRSTFVAKRPTTFLR